MKAIAKDIIIQNYNIVATDEQVIQEQEKNKERGVHISDVRVRRTIIKERVIELIGDEKKKTCFFIYEGTVSHSIISKILQLSSLPCSVKNIMVTFPIEQLGTLSSKPSFLQVLNLAAWLPHLRANQKIHHSTLFTRKQLLWLQLR